MAKQTKNSLGRRSRRGPPKPRRRGGSDRHSKRGGERHQAFTWQSSHIASSRRPVLRSGDHRHMRDDEAETSGAAQPRRLDVATITRLPRTSPPARAAAVEALTPREIVAMAASMSGGMLVRIISCGQTSDDSGASASSHDTIWRRRPNRIGPARRLSAAARHHSCRTADRNNQPWPHQAA